MTAPALAFNKRGLGRHYRHPTTGVEVPSVTNIIGVLDKPALPRWAAKMVAEAAWKMRSSLVEMGEDECIDVLKGSPWRNSGRAASRGTSVHDYLDAAAKGLPLPTLGGDASRYKRGADEFLETYQPIFIRSEFTVFGDGYAGTADFVADIEGRRVIGDYKTSKALYPEIALQLAAIRYAHTIVGEHSGDQDMWEVDGCIGVLITPDGCEVREVDAGPEAYAAFRACLTAWQWQKTGSPLGDVLDVVRRVAS